MIGRLPTTLLVDGEERGIRTDYRTILTVFVAIKDPELNDYEKTIVILECIYEDVTFLNDSNSLEAVEMANWFMDGGSSVSDDAPSRNSKPVLDWEQDEQMIFAAINKVAGREIRNDEYLHWWTFLGYFNSLGECLLNTVILIRDKKNNRKKLDKTEEEFYKKNKSLIDIKRKKTARDLADEAALNDLL